MKNTVGPLDQIQKPEETYFNKGVKIITNKIEEFIVHKTQTERRKALFGRDPMAEVK